MSNTARYLRTEPAAKYCNSTKSTFEKWRVTGGGPPFMRVGRTVIYDLMDLDAWLAASKRHSTSEVVGAEA